MVLHVFDPLGNHFMKVWAGITAASCCAQSSHMKGNGTGPLVEPQ